MNSQQDLRDRALGPRIGTVCAAFAEMIRDHAFVLTEGELAATEARGEPLLVGWVFAYRVSAADSSARLRLLPEGSKSTEPRIREHVCDLIGDIGLPELAPILQLLKHDPVSFVAEAAQANLEMLGI